MQLKLKTQTQQNLNVHAENQTVNYSLCMKSNLGQEEGAKYDEE